MKNIALLMMPLLFAAACNKEHNLGPNDQSHDLGDQWTPRKVLLEEYTGHLCTNCPDGAVKAQELRARYGAENVIVLSIHGGLLATTVTDLYPEDLTSEAGNAIYERFNPVAQPLGMINRKENGNAYGVMAWEAQAKPYVNTTALVDLRNASTYDENSRKLNITMDVKTVKYLPDGDYKMVCFLVEDNIVAPQLYHGQRDEDYIHRHVLREAVSPVWGDSFLEGRANPNDEFQVSYEIDVKEKYNVQNLYVLSFVYNAARSSEILQVQETKVIP